MRVSAVVFRLALSVLAAGLLAMAAATQRPERPDRTRAATPKLQALTYKTSSFESQALGRDADYGIFLPKDYNDAANQETSYPLIIWLHGLFEDHKRFHDRGGAEVLDRAVRENELPPVIFVTANGGNSFYLNGATPGSGYEDMIVKDLLPHLEATYRVAKERSQRALFGTSMGGYGALNIAFKHPELFGVVAAHSAALLPADPAELPKRFTWLERWGGSKRAMGALFGDPMDTEKWTAENVMLRAEKISGDDLHGLKVYFDCGDQDRYGFNAPNEELHQILEKRKIKHTWRCVEGGNHGWGAGYNQQVLPYSLRFAATSFVTASGLGGLLGPKEPDKADPGDGKESDKNER